MTKSVACVVALFLGCMGLQSPASGQQAAARGGAIVVGQETPLDAMVLEHMHVNRYSVQTLVTPEENVAEWSLPVTLGGDAYILDLHPTSVRGDEFRVRVQGPDGVLREVEAPSIKTMKGDVRGMPSSSVRGSLVAGGVDLIVTLSDGSVWGVQAQAMIDPAAPQGAHIVYDNRDDVPMPGVCGGAIVLPGMGQDDHGDGIVTRGGLTRICEIAFDADVEYYQANGSSVFNTVNDIESVMNAIEGIYELNTGVTFEVTEIVVRTAEPDPYSSNDAGTILDEFRNTWIGSTYTPIRRDIAHMMTNKSMGNVLGIAYLNGVCNNLGYGVSRSRWSTNLARRRAVTAHEIGHNFSAGHCDQDPPCNANPVSECKIMCAAIQSCSSDITQFSACEAGVIETYADGRSCLAQLQPSITPPFSDGFPSTTLDTVKWVYNKGGAINTAGVSEPSSPNSLELDAAGSGTYQDDDIRTHFIVMTGVSSPVLRYSVQARGVTSGEQLIVEVWTSQLRWVVKNTITSDGVDDATYTQYTHVLSGVDLHAETRVRFRTLVDATSDNWYIDDVYVGTDGAPPNGSCCISGNCTVTTQAACAGTWTLAGVCSPNPCSQPTGSCCIAGNCTVTTQSGCTGAWTLNGVCSPNPCTVPTGACCYPQFNQCFVISQTQCELEGGLFQGSTTTCVTVTCPEGTGACCISDGTCLTLTQTGCDAAGGEFGGLQSECSPGLCPVLTGACCVNSTCVVVSQADCTTQGGSFHGANTVCDANICAAPTGACCVGVVCAIATSTDCATQGGTYSGAGTACNAPGNNTQPCCRADFDHNGTVEVPDIFAYLSAWFASSPAADVDGGGVTVPDIFGYLSLWFANCQ